MELWMFLLCVIPSIVTSITISPNGNSPETKMIGGMTGVQKRNTEAVASIKSKHATNIRIDSPKLAINERYRRLIPYMTFYYANDLVPPPPKQDLNNIEVEKAEIVEAGTVRPVEREREPKLIYTPQRHKNIPRYHGNRLTQFNIASSNPTKVYYEKVPVLYQNTQKVNPSYNPTIEQNVYNNRDLPYDRYVPKQIKSPSTPFSVPTRKPVVNIYQNEAHSPNVQYYSSEQETQKYRLVPYEQTPPVKVDINTSVNQYRPNTLTTQEPVYIKARPSLRPQPFYETQVHQQVPKKSSIVSEVYYEKRPTLVEPVIESGFRPIIKPHIQPTETPDHSISPEELSYNDYQNEKQQESPIIESVPVATDDVTYRPQYVIERPINKPEQDTSNSVSLAELLNSLQINKSIPKPITRENISDSIRTLLQVLNTLKAAPLMNEVEAAVVSTPKPFEPSEISVATPAPYITSTTPKPQEPELHDEPYLAPVQTPSQYLDDYPSGGGSSQRFPLPVTSDEEGGTPGRPGVDYPILTVIPPTKFDCKTQRYKGFFADTDTRCQVWHYCDLNGGQASFLCPNGTIFSQAALTCDWWFNVRCASTTQLYVLNESLYKYILPHSPKFPEDYSGPLVDKYLSLKFKEMEEQFKKNKNKKVATEKNDSEETDSSEASEEDTSTEVAESSKTDETLVNQAGVTVETSGNSGNVQRLQDE